LIQHAPVILLTLFLVGGFILLFRKYFFLEDPMVKISEEYSAVNQLKHEVNLREEVIAKYIWDKHMLIFKYETKEMERRINDAKEIMLMTLWKLKFKKLEGNKFDENYTLVRIKKQEIKNLRKELSDIKESYKKSARKEMDDKLYSGSFKNE
jgi:hypothetical protein